MESLKGIFREKGIPFLLDEPLKQWCSFKIGGRAEIFAEPSNPQDIGVVLVETKKGSVPLLVLGKGTNTLVSDKGFHGVVMHIGKNMAHMELIGDNRVLCQSGAKLSDLCIFALENELTGMEELYGIPGSVGGAVFMNGGAYGGETKNVAVSASYVDQQGRIGEIVGEDLAFGYRHSAFTDNGYIITSAIFQLKKGNHSEIKARMDDFMGRRLEKQPLEFPSAGSTFKRPEGNYASAIIDQCGLKGARVGDAKVSEKHGGFVVNVGEASFDDVMNVISHVKKTVWEQKAIKLECEIIIIE